MMISDPAGKYAAPLVRSSGESSRRTISMVETSSFLDSGSEPESRLSISRLFRLLD